MGREWTHDPIYDILTSWVKVYMCFASLYAVLIAIELYQTSCICYTHREQAKKDGNENDSKKSRLEKLKSEIIEHKRACVDEFDKEVSSH